jgi:hypothetical protein
MFDVHENPGRRGLHQQSWSRSRDARLISAIVLVVALGAWAAESAFAAPILTPPGLNPGDEFRIVFISSQRRDATSSDISDYDTFIADLAAAAGLTSYFGVPVTWQALGSTSAVSALSRVPLASPALYLLDGTKVADGGADLWDGTVDAAIVLSESLTNEDDSMVLTGTLADGSASATAPLGGPASVLFGIALSGNLDADWVASNEVIFTIERSIYGVSSILTVPVPTAPEPAGLGLLLVSAAALAGRRWRSRRFPSRD